MRYAVIKTGGKQYKVTEGQVIEVERLDISSGPGVVFSDVLLVAGDGTPTVGTPLVSNVQVIGKVMENFKGEKIRVAKFKDKARYRRVTGHRQSLTRIQIESIGKAEKSTQPAKNADEKASPRKTASRKTGK